MSPTSPSNRPAAWVPPLVILTALCVIAGALARFWGLGKWPLAIDEYYFAQSVQNLLHSGLPAFPCGGLYIRGVLLQYTAALLQLIGLSPELAPRAIAAVCSMLTLPAAYLIGRRLGGREAALLTVIVLGLSVWEIEIGRFGRMYAPFQALFAWYLVFFLSFAIDRNRRAMAPMIILSALGLGVWEGGIFLVLTNLLPPFIANPSSRLTRNDWLYLVGCSLLFIPAYILTMADLRMAFSDPTLPPDYVEPPDEVSQSRLDTAVMPLKTLRAHLGAVVAFILPLALVCWAGLRQLRSQPSALAVLGVWAALAFAALHQFELTVGVLVIVILLDIVKADTVTGAAGRSLWLAVLACFAFWLAFGMLTADWHAPGMSEPKTAFLLIYEFVRFPDTVRQIAMPWARTVPLLSLGLLILTGACLLRAVLRPESTSKAERITLAVFVILFLAAGASNPPRHETRYVFFLYPLAILFSILTLQRLATAVVGSTRPSVAAVVSAVGCLALFGLSEDFRPAHLWNIDSEAINFRLGMSGRLAGHYHPRSDVRAAAVWLQDHAVPGQDLIIDAYPGVDFYYRKTDYFFVSDTDGRFDVWSCKRGTIQRWSNLPMIHSYDTLQAKVASGRKVWMVLEAGSMPGIVGRFPQGDWTLKWTAKTRDIVIVLFQHNGTTG